MPTAVFRRHKPELVRLAESKHNILVLIHHSACSSIHEFEGADIVWFRELMNVGEPETLLFGLKASRCNPKGDLMLTDEMRARPASGRERYLAEEGPVAQSS